MQRQGNTSPRNKPGLRLNLVLLIKWYAETWFKLGLTKPSLNKLDLIKTGLNRFKLSLRGNPILSHIFQQHKPSFTVMLC